MKVREMRCPSQVMRWMKLVSVLILLLAASAALANEQGAASAPPDGKQFREAYIGLQEQLAGLFRTQATNGAYRFDGCDSLLHAFPLIATLSLELHNTLGDPSFTSRAIASTTRYIKFQLQNEDLDEDCLVERRVSPDEAAQRGRIEDVGYNALLALDCMSLSQLCTDVKKPVDALFWHEEAKLIATRLIDATYDGDAGFFFPYDNQAQERTRYVHAMSLLPSLFAEYVGDDAVRTAIRRYLLTAEYFYPEAPHAYLTWNDFGAENSGATDAERVMKTAALLCVLHHAGFTEDEERYRGRVTHAIDSLNTVRSASAPDPYAAALELMLRTGRYRVLFPVYNSLDILVELVLDKRTLDDPEIIRLIKSAGVVRRALYGEAAPQSADTTETPDAETLETDIRTIYVAVSRIREQLKDTSIVSPWKESAYFGAEFPQAVAGLLDDVVLSLQRAENILFAMESRAGGLRVSCRLQNERLVPSQRPRLAICVTSDKQPIGVRSISVDIPPQRVLLFDSRTAATVVPGDSTLSFTFDAPVRLPEVTGIFPLHLAVSVERDNGSTCRAIFVKSVHLEKPLTFSVDFPRGRILGKAELPITIAMKKNMPGNMTAQASFFSPSGLALREGASVRLLIDAQQDSAYAELHVVPPQPCRPGAFPFLLKVFSDGDEMGTVSSSFFKHYQWIFAGPFDRGPARDNERYEPEKRIDLNESFRSGGRIFTWKDLPEGAYAPNGEILLDELMPAGGVGYLHTVVESAVQQDCPVFLAANTPGVVFLNGAPAARITSADITAPIRSVLQLREGPNEILIKTTSPVPPKLYFKLGDDEYLASDEFNNNLAELIDGYRAFHERADGAIVEPGEARKLVTLSYTDAGARSVAIIGSFNGWSPEHAAMQRASKNRWEITLNLEPGKYTYRFLINNRQHVLDPSCTYQESDGYGGKNSVLFVE